MYKNCIKVFNDLRLLLLLLYSYMCFPNIICPIPNGFYLADQYPLAQALVSVDKGK
jgi:hypothetical protein